MARSRVQKYVTLEEVSDCNKIDRIPLCEHRRRLVTVMYERPNDIVGNPAFEFNVSSSAFILMYAVSFIIYITV